MAEQALSNVAVRETGRLAEGEATLSEYVRPLVGKSFGARAVSYIIDAIVIYLSSYAIGFVGALVPTVALMVLQGREPLFDLEALGFWSNFLGLVLNVLYFTSFEWLYGATVGKLLLGMRVVMEDGEPCTLRASMVRALLRYIDGFFFAIPAYKSMKGPSFQRIGDKRAKTIVVDSRELRIQAHRDWGRIIAGAVLYFTAASILAVAIYSLECS